mmetsp:Transcript_14522/g.35479  ORF Transcript_14522/g.35479 Transcript_14522/m.35479 type:complete len:235 (-) Transcript_14522:1130-1834(-)
MYAPAAAMLGDAATPVSDTRSLGPRPPPPLPLSPPSMPLRLPRVHPCAPGVPSPSSSLDSDSDGPELRVTMGAGVLIGRKPRRVMKSPELELSAPTTTAGCARRGVGVPDPSIASAEAGESAASVAFFSDITATALSAVAHTAVFGGLLSGVRSAHASGNSALSDSRMTVKLGRPLGSRAQHACTRLTTSGGSHVGSLGRRCKKATWTTICTGELSSSHGYCSVMSSHRITAKE